MQTPWPPRARQLTARGSPDQGIVRVKLQHLCIFSASFKHFERADFITAP
jgi:hypothetical protein